MLANCAFAETIACAAYDDKFLACLWLTLQQSEKENGKREGAKTKRARVARRKRRKKSAHTN
jgi:transcriptional antiterminator Rof (Rho-off)